MANALYDPAKEAFLGGDIDLITDVVRAVLIDTGVYTFSAAHAFYSQLSGVVGTESPVFTAKSITNGVFDADDIVFTAVTGDTVEALVIFQDTGNPATDRLIAYIDSANSGLPAAPNGSDITVVWSVTGILSL